MADKDPLSNDECGTKFYLPRAVLYTVIVVLIAGAILIFGE